MKRSNTHRIRVSVSLFLLLLALTRVSAQDLSYRSRFLAVSLSPERPGFQSLQVDALGRGQLRSDTLRATPADGHTYRVERSGSVVHYSLDGAAKPVWSIRFASKSIWIESRYAGVAQRGLTLTFNPDQVHATLLGRPSLGNEIALPAILHLPGMGSFRISSEGDDASLAYEAKRSGTAFIQIGFHAADASHRHRKYLLQVVSIAPKAQPDIQGLALDGLRRNFLNIFQWNADLHVLANNAASDSCAFTLYKYADLAVHTPPLAKGLTAMDLVRITLDRYLTGFKGYGMPGWQAFDAGPSRSQPYTFSDVYPSLLISASDYVRTTHDISWTNSNYAKLRAWTEAMLATDTSGDGLIKYGASGNSGSWGSETIRPANWWDTIGFGYEDAYSNALAYRALLNMTAIAVLEHRQDDAARYRASAQKLRRAYKKTFFNPQTGLLAGWKSADGQLHDYAFTFVNGIAIRYGLIDEPTAQSILTHLLNTMKNVGYTRFDLGLPGNLIPVRRADYFTTERRWGGSASADGRDGFEIYENGGATACFSYFLIAALAQEGRPESQRILVPILESIANHGFSGKGADGMTNDWKDWQGGAHGYEGMLVDNYYVFLAAVERRAAGQSYLLQTTEEKNK